MSTRVFQNIVTFFLALALPACSSLTPQPTSVASEAEIEKEEQAVYSYFVKDRDPALIAGDTSTDIAGSNPQQMLNSIKSNFKEVSQETLDNYVERNQQPSQLSPDMDLGVEYKLLSNEELSQVMSEPGSGGYLMFSRVGFNPSLDQALVYVADVAGPLAASGFYYLMAKKDGEWMAKESIMVWIS